jgi:thiamine pyrophosphokinase
LEETNEMKKIDAVILANGDYPSAPMPLKVLQEAPYVVCCDGGANEYIAQGYLPDVIIGDGDSLRLENRIKYASLIQHNPDQETNDQTKAFSFALGLVPPGTEADIHILGTTGGREEHSLGNISLLMEYTKNRGYAIAPFNNIIHEGINVDIVTDNGIFTPHYNSFEKGCRAGQQVSTNSFDNTIRIKSAGLRYPTDNATFEFWWSGTLNEAVGESFSLEFSHSAPVLLFMLY